MIHILEANDKIQRIASNDKEFQNESTILALERLLQTLSESAYKLSDDFKNNNPQIQWNLIKPFRNILVHDYLGDIIDRKILLEVIYQDLPKLVEAIEITIPDWRIQKEKTIERDKTLKLYKE